MKPKSIDEYISGFPQETQTALESIRNVIRNAAPNATEAIAYDMPTFKLNGNLIHFAAWKNHIGLYAISEKIYKRFENQLAIYNWKKGSLQFPLDKSMPLELIAEIVRLRVLENSQENAGHNN
jgi:uncharacterized protein YdhG (YjbR/CyaY superfamily)